MQNLKYAPYKSIPTLALCAAGSVALSAIGDPLPDHVYGQVEVVLQIRDFNQSHPDFQSTLLQSHPLIGNGATPGMVLSSLDADGNPEANPDHLANGFTDGQGQMITSESDFAQWYRDVPGINTLIRRTITMDWDESTGVYVYERSHSNSDGFFPIDGEGFGETMSWGGLDHNYHFTTEIEMPFLYTDPASRAGMPMIFEFSGDDDLWVFLNGELILDIGGVHPAVSASVNIDDLATAHGLNHGEMNVLKVFHAERMWAHSNFKIQTSILLVPSEMLPLFD